MTATEEDKDGGAWRNGGELPDFESAADCRPLRGGANEKIERFR